MFWVSGPERSSHVISQSNTWEAKHKYLNIKDWHSSKIVQYNILGRLHKRSWPVQSLPPPSPSISTFQNRNYYSNLLNPRPWHFNLDNPRDGVSDRACLYKYVDVRWDESRHMLRMCSNVNNCSEYHNVTRQTWLTTSSQSYLRLRVAVPGSEFERVLSVNRQVPPELRGL